MTPQRLAPSAAQKSFKLAGGLTTSINALIAKFKQKRDALRFEFADAAPQNPVTDFHNIYSHQVDDLLRAIAHTFRTAKSSQADGLPAVIAIGGYGRAELAPFSDVDVLFVTETTLSPAGRKLVETLQASFWAAGIKISASTRTLAECGEALKSDFHFMTSLLENRLVWGQKPLYRQLQAVLKRHMDSVTPGSFIAAKLAEQEARHRKMGDSRYQLQPNVKESKGALRDIQTLFWLSNALYGISTADGLVEKQVLEPQEAAALKNAHDFFWRIRCHLQIIAGRAEDRLSFDLQPEVAKKLGYNDPEPNRRAEKFMKDYFLRANDIGHLTRVICADLEARALAVSATAGTRRISVADEIGGFPVSHNRLTIADKKHFADHPADMLRIFRVSQTSGYDIHPDALRALRRQLEKPGAKKSPLAGHAEAIRIFFEILLDTKGAERTLRQLNEAGVLLALLPDFANIHAHMQYDMYHVYTADEHTIRAIGIMHRLENGELAEAAPLATALFPKIHSRRALYAAMFLHDMAKGTGGNHSQKGGEIAKRLCPLLGLSDEETETVVWLVEQHLVMTFAAFKRDLNDSKTVEDFVREVQSPERLKLIQILTVADIMAVGPDRWNNWKSGLLSELYYKAAEYMSGTPKSGAEDNDQFMILQKKARRLVGDQGATLQYIADHAPKYFWLSFTPEAIAGFVKALHKNTGPEATVIRISPQLAGDFTEVFVFTKDRKGLFATLSGAMAAAGASIVDARIFTLSNGMALDVFQIQDIGGHGYDNTNFLQKTLKAALAGQLDLTQEIAERQKNAPRKTRLFRVQPRVIIDNNASATNTVIEVNGLDRPGFLYDITAALHNEGLQISAAKVTTFGTRAVDVFYVKDTFGLKIFHRDKLARIEKTLLHVLEKNHQARI